ncbi:hypothetical protein HDU80_011378 [Chytriomyces hyalinus]|nr:hypothetical protein HDU80_011378 [Chytriomyces hyalinus]
MGHKQHPDALLWQIIYSQLEGDSVDDSCKRLFLKPGLVRRTRANFNTYGTLWSPFASTGGRKRIIDERVKVFLV